MSDTDLQALIRQAEMQKLQAQLNNQFHNNMVLFQKSIPALFEQFVKYQPQQYRLSFAPEGYLTIVDARTNKSIYETDPVEFTSQQLDEFRKKPLCLRQSFLKTGVSNEDYIHAPLVNELIDTFEQNPPREQVSLNGKVNFLAILGTGIGYSISDLVANQDIYHLMIVEPNLDLFYASLHTIDWTPILNKQTQQHRTLKFCIGYSPHDTLEAFKHLPNEIGLYNLANSFFYQHLYSPQLNATRDILINGYHQLAIGTGFFDDERVSLAHTVSHLKQGINLHIPTPSAKNGTVIIVGNGPSLDNKIDALKKFQDHACILSCGTALGALYKANIKPDYHVEMERTLNIKEWIIKGSDVEFRKGITLLTLNTCPPEVTRLFDNVIMAKKTNDLGAGLINSLIPNPGNDLYYCNPTVTNCATSYAVKSGYENVIFLGVDLGQVDLEKSHSNLSLYDNTILSRRAPWEKNSKRHFLAKSSTNEKIYTTAILDSTRTNLEEIISQHSGVNFYNLSEGVDIIGSPKITPDMLTPEGEGKIKGFSSKRFTFKNDSIEKIVNDIVQNYSISTNKLLEILDNTTYNKDHLFAQLAKTESSHIHHLLRGSINTLLAIDERYMGFSDKEKSNLSRKSQQALIKFLSQSRNKLLQDPLQHDRTAQKTKLINSEEKVQNKYAAAPDISGISSLDSYGYCGPFKLNNSKNSTAVANFTYQINQPGENKNCHTNPIIQALLNDTNIQQQLMRHCPKDLGVWSSMLHWHYEKHPSKRFTHNRFSSGIDGLIDFDNIGQEYLLIIAIHDCTIDSGAIEFCEYSHKKIDNLERPNKPAYKLNPSERQVTLPKGLENNILTLEMKAGEFCIMHASILRRFSSYKKNTPSLWLLAYLKDSKLKLPNEIPNVNLENEYPLKSSSS